MTTDLERIGRLSVSRETMDRLHLLSDLILKWTKSINLIAPKSTGDIWTRHIVDSTQVYELAPKSWENWIDIGSGGGLPGLVVAVLDPDRQPITLIESDQRKCLFLNTARRELDLNVRVLHDRIENVDIDRADIISARALAPLPQLMGFGDKLLHSDGVALFQKGERFQEELDQARTDWQFDCTAHQSQTNAASRVLEITRIRRRGP